MKKKKQEQIKVPHVSNNIELNVANMHEFVNVLKTNPAFNNYDRITFTMIFLMEIGFIYLPTQKVLWINDEVKYLFWKENKIIIDDRMNDILVGYMDGWIEEFESKFDDAFTDKVLNEFLKVVELINEVDKDKEYKLELGELLYKNA